MKKIDISDIAIIGLGVGLCLVVWAFGTWHMIEARETREAQEAQLYKPADPIVLDGICLMEEEVAEKIYFEISDEERELIQYIVAGEAGYEPMDGKIAVAQCILNAMMLDDLSAFEVQDKYKYSGFKTNLDEESPEAWAEVVQAVSDVFDEGQTVTEEYILWFYAPKYSAGKFHNTQKFVMEIGGHRFYAPWN